LGGTGIKPYREFFANYVRNLVCLRTRWRRFRPLVTNFYITKQCNLRCRYCYPPGDEPEVDTAVAVELLKKIRPHNPLLNFTGGEPLLHPDLPILLREAKALQFQPLMLSTNGLLIENIIDHLHYVDHLVISLDSLSESVNDLMVGMTGATREIVEKIRLCADLAPKNDYRLGLHAAIAPETLDGLEELVDFCEELGITLSVSPENGCVLPHEGLVDNNLYEAAIDRLIDWKRRGKPIASSFGYLQKIRTFGEHSCYPFLSPRVEPDGRVYLPCQRLKERHVFLQDYESLNQLMLQESNWGQNDPECRHRCYLGCYLEVDEYLHHPLGLLKEPAMRRWMLGPIRNLGGRYKAESRGS
jgi:MoaA/NifB/PqqE/SkfB family radical SAM enzyme